jgi:hypothetical protein
MHVFHLKSFFMFNTFKIPVVAVLIIIIMLILTKRCHLFYLSKIIKFENCLENSWTLYSEACYDYFLPIHTFMQHWPQLRNCGEHQTTLNDGKNLHHFLTDIIIVYYDNWKIYSGHLYHEYKSLLMTRHFSPKFFIYFDLCIQDTSE